MTTIVALIQNGTVVGVQPSDHPGVPLDQQFHADLNPTDVTNVSPQPQVGWSATANGQGGWTFAAPPAPPAPTLAQQAQAAQIATVVLTSTGTAALDGTYAIDTESQSDMKSEILAFDTNSAFLDGNTSTIAWPDTSGALHTFTAAQFKAFVTAVGAYVGLMKSIARTNALPSGMISFPTNAITIA